MRGHDCSSYYCTSFTDKNNVVLHVFNIFHVKGSQTIKLCTHFTPYVPCLIC